MATATRSRSSTCGGGLAPNWSSETSTYVPTGATFVDAAGPAGYAGHLVFCTYDKGMAIVTAGSPHAHCASGPSGCRLDVVEGAEPRPLLLGRDPHL